MYETQQQNNEKVKQQNSEVFLKTQSLTVKRSLVANRPIQTTVSSTMKPCRSDLYSVLETNEQKEKNEWFHLKRSENKKKLELNTNMFFTEKSR